jgi:glyoxylase-like metal-dependent hydrolase (beta-lactamase superfamily II)
MALQFDRSLDVTYRTVDEVVPGVRRIVAENPGPFTFKGSATFIVGKGEVAVIDPGPADEKHIDALLESLGSERVTHILITHTHADHSPGARLLQERTGAKTYGFGPHPIPTADEEKRYADVTEPPTNEATDTESKTTSNNNKKDNDNNDNDNEQQSAEDKKELTEEGHGDRDFVPDVAIRHSELIAGSGWTFEAVHTPGHLANHLCFRLAKEKLLFTGDHVMGWSTSVISPPGGHLNDYLASMALLLENPDEIYIPTHGSPIVNPHDYVRGLIDHRNARTAQILDRLRNGPQNIKGLVAALYVGLDPKLFKAAGRSVLAHLDALVRSGSVHVECASDSANMITASYRLT